MNCKTIFILSLALSSKVWCEDQDKAISPYVQIGYVYDSNILKTHDSASAFSATGATAMSDSIESAVIGVDSNKSFGNQRFDANFQLTDNKFQRLQGFNNTDKTGKVNWSWSATKSLNGNFGYVHEEQLTPFDYFKSYQKNMQTTSTVYAGYVWDLTKEVSYRGQFNSTRLYYSLPDYSAYQFTQSQWEQGLDYKTGRGSSVGAFIRHLHANYPESSVVDNISVNNSFVQDELKAKILWKVTEKSSLEFVGGVAKRKRDNDSLSRYQGFDARLTGEWNISNKLKLKSNIWHELAGLQQLDANYALTKGVDLRVNWGWTPKVGLEATGSYEHRDYNGVAIVTGVSPSGRKDLNRSYGVSLAYEINRTWALKANVARQDVTSNISSNNYKSNSVSVTTKYQYQ